MQNHYKTLGVSKLSSDDEIKQSYHMLARRHHPDRHNNDPDMAAKMSEVNVAYNVLKDSKKRKEYDRQLALFGKPCPECKGQPVKMKQQGFHKKIHVVCEHCRGTGVGGY